MGIGGILSKFISRMNDPEIGKYEGYFLPEPVAPWYGSFYTDYMTYLDIAGRDSVLAAEVASPETQVTIQFIAMALEQAEERARANEQDLREYLENRTIADIVEQFTQDENCAWLMNSDFFMGNNGSFATVREVSEASHDIMMGDTISSDVSMADADSPREEGGQGQAATLDDTAATAQSGGSLETAGLSSSSASAPRTILGVEAPPGLLAIEDIKPDKYYRATDQIRSAFQNLGEAQMGTEQRGHEKMQFWRKIERLRCNIRKNERLQRNRPVAVSPAVDCVALCICAPDSHSRYDRRAAFHTK